MDTLGCIGVFTWITRSQDLFDRGSTTGFRAVPHGLLETALAESCALSGFPAVMTAVRRTTVPQRGLAVKSQAACSLWIQALGLCRKGADDSRQAQK